MAAAKRLRTTGMSGFMRMYSSYTASYTQTALWKSLVLFMPPSTMTLLLPL